MPPKKKGGGGLKVSKAQKGKGAQKNTGQVRTRNPKLSNQEKQSLKKDAPTNQEMLQKDAPRVVRSAEDAKMHSNGVLGFTELSATALDAILFGVIGFNPNKKHANGKEAMSLQSIFVKEARHEVDERVVLSRNPLKSKAPGTVPEAWLVQHLEHPMRPPWDKSMTKEELHAWETKHFHQWLGRIYSKYEPKHLNYFEHNLEVWRQLWRVIEKSHVIVIVADARNPLVHIPLPLVREVQRKGIKLIILLNKVDLLPTAQIKAWMVFLQAYIKGCRVVPFTAHPDRIKGRKVIGRQNQSFPDPATDPAVLTLMKLCGVKMREGLGGVTKKDEENQRRKEGGGAEAEAATAAGATAAADVASNVVRDGSSTAAKQAAEEKEAVSVFHRKQKKKADLKDQRKDMKSLLKFGNAGKRRGASSNLTTTHRTRGMLADVGTMKKRTSKYTTQDLEEKWGNKDLSSVEAATGNAALLAKAEAGRRAAKEAAIATTGVVIGVIGQPSVGKTSVLNRVVGRIVGSESRTAGHTKYFQTIPLSHLGEATIVDCPGLLFPALNTADGGVPRCLQEAFGMYDTAQVREPFSAIRFMWEYGELGEGLTAHYNIRHPEEVKQAVRDQQFRQKQAALGIDTASIAAAEVEATKVPEVAEAVAKKGEQEERQAGGMEKVLTALNDVAEGTPEMMSMEELSIEETPETLTGEFAKSMLDEDQNVDGVGVHSATGGGQAAAKLASRGSDNRHGDGQYADDSCRSIMLLSENNVFSGGASSPSSSIAAATSASTSSSSKYPWSPHILAGCVAVQRSLYLRGGGPDVHSAGLSVMKDAVDGVLSVAFNPPPVPEKKPEKALEKKPQPQEKKQAKTPQQPEVALEPTEAT
jgi:ribosome biogenesis GTPase A